MRQAIKEIEVSMAYRYPRGLVFMTIMPHFSTFGKNYKRKVEGSDLFEEIFQKILFRCMKYGLVDTNTLL